MKIDAIIQARMGSTRLPGKVLMKLNGISLLECLVTQLNYSKFIERKIIATSVNREDNAIVELAKILQVPVFRGNSLDVLDRYYQCAKQYSIQHIVRITADNPLIDPQIVDEVIDVYRNGSFDYVSNCEKRTFPYGTEVEIFSFESLEKAWGKAKDPSEREHVTPFIINHSNKNLKRCIEYHDKDLSNFRWTVDRIEDLEFVKEVYGRIHKRPILLKDILEIIKSNPQLHK